MENILIDENIEESKQNQAIDDHTNSNHNGQIYDSSIVNT